MDPLATLVVALAIAGMVAWVVFTHAKVAARQSPGRRKVVLFANLLAVLSGAALGLWLASRTTASPSSLVANILLSIVAGGLVLLGIAAFLGAWFACPHDHDTGSA